MPYGFSAKQLKFIADEFGYNAEQLENADEALYDKMYDDLCDIEVETTLEAGDNDLSERGKLAESLVTLMGGTAEDRGDTNFDDMLKQG